MNVGVSSIPWGSPRIHSIRTDRKYEGRNVFLELDMFSPFDTLPNNMIEVFGATTKKKHVIQRKCVKLDVK